MLRLVSHDGLSPLRAAHIARVDPELLDHPKLQRLALRAESFTQLRALRLINGSLVTGNELTQYAEANGNLDSQQASRKADSQQKAEGSTATTQSVARAATRTRSWQKVDWRAPAWLLERRFPQEWGQQSTVNLEVTPAASFLAKLADMASKRGELGDRKPRALPEGAPKAPQGTP